MREVMVARFDDDYKEDDYVTRENAYVIECERAENIEDSIITIYHSEDKTAKFTWNEIPIRLKTIDKLIDMLQTAKLLLRRSPYLNCVPNVDLSEFMEQDND